MIERFWRYFSALSSAVGAESRIPPSSRIAGLWWTGARAAEVRAQFRRVKPRKRLLAMSIGVRGWTLDVLDLVLGSATVPVAVRNVPL
jgi:hypothetical protein